MTSEKRTYTRAEIEGMTQRELEASANELIAAAAEGRIDFTPTPVDPPPVPAAHPTGRPWITRSQLNGMPPPELEARYGEIDQAFREGRVLFDR